MIDCLALKTSSTQHVVGIDLGNAKHAICVTLRSTGEIIDQRNITNHRESLRRLSKKWLRATCFRSSSVISRLKRSRYFWLRREEGIHPEKREAFEALRDSDLKTARAWAIKAAARGFRNFEHYRIRILFFCGRLALQPDPTH